MRNYIRLVDLGTIITGNTPPTSDKGNYSSSDVKFVKPSDIATNCITDIESTEFHISNKAKEKARIVPAHSVLVTCIGIIGKIAITYSECAFNQQINAIIPDESKINYEYLAYSIYSQHSKIQEIANAPVVPIINKTRFGEIRIPVDSLENQIKYIERLNKISCLVAIRKQQLAKLDELVKSRFIEMFGDCSCKPANLIDLIITGAGLSYGIVQPGDNGTGQMGVLRPVDLINGQISTDNIKYIDPIFGNGYEKTKLTGDELLITIRGTTGITALTDCRFKGMNVTRGIAVIRYNKRLINPIYLNSCLNNQKSQIYILEHTRGATLRQINLADLRKLEIKVPSLCLQNTFANFVSQLDKSKFVIQKSLERLEILQKSLMQEYFG